MGVVVVGFFFFLFFFFAESEQLPYFLPFLVSSKTESGNFSLGSLRFSQSCYACVSVYSVVSDCSQSWQPTNLFCPWNFLLQRIFLIQGSNPSLLHCQEDSLALHHLGSPNILRDSKQILVAKKELFLCPQNGMLNITLLVLFPFNLCFGLSHPMSSLISNPFLLYCKGKSLGNAETISLLKSMPVLLWSS